VYFDSFSAALAMDGHGIFVWPAYIIASIAVAWLLIIPKRRERKVLAQLAGDIRRQQVQSDTVTGEQ
jgi:heme exporter protein D